MKDTCLYLLPISISELKNDWISESYKETLKQCSVFFVENTRTARRFISSLKLGISIDSLEFIEIGKHADSLQKAEFVQKLKSGVKAAVMSESGCPGVADPGSLVVQLAHENQIKVIPLVGPSSILLALMASGLNGQAFSFRGYLPLSQAERKSALKKLEQDSRQGNCTQIFIETPFRNQQLFRTALEVLHAETRFCIAIDLSGDEQKIEMKKAKDWRKAALPEWPKLPAIFLIQA